MADQAGMDPTGSTVWDKLLSGLAGLPGDTMVMQAFNVLKALTMSTLMFSSNLLATFWEAMDYPGPTPAKDRPPTIHR